MNPLLKRLNGRIGLTGLLKFLMYRREINGLRLLMFGIKEKYRQLGLPMLAFHHIYEVVRKKEKYRYLEMGWTLEDNESINSLIEEAGAKIIQKISHIQKIFIVSEGETYRLECGGWDIVAEHRVSIIGFVWRPEEITPSVIQMAERTGSRAIFDFSMMGVDGLRSFLRKADPAGHVRDIKISAPAFFDPSLGQLLKETGVHDIWVECQPQFFREILPSFYRD